MNQAINIKPNFTAINNTTAIFQTSSITYNQAGVQYTSGTVKYGGADYKQDPGPKNISVTNF